MKFPALESGPARSYL